MADYRYEITTGGLDTQVEDVRTLMLNYPTIRYKISGQWRRKSLQNAVTVTFLQSTSSGVNKSDLDAIAQEIVDALLLLPPTMTFVLTNFATTIQYTSPVLP